MSTARRAYSRDLFDCIDLHRRLSEPTARKIFSQVLAAVAYLQSQVRRVHRGTGVAEATQTLIRHGAGRPYDDRTEPGAWRHQGRKHSGGPQL
jgi:hypothetical protein